MTTIRLLEHEQCVLDEATSLAVKIGKLRAFIADTGEGGKFPKCSERQQELLVRQHAAMVNYLSILNERIGDFLASGPPATEDPE